MTDMDVKLNEKKEEIKRSLEESISTLSKADDIEKVGLHLAFIKIVCDGWLEDIGFKEKDLIDFFEKIVKEEEDV